MYIVFTYEFIPPPLQKKKCANVVNEIFCFLFLICLLSNSYIPISFALRANFLQHVKHYEKKIVSFLFCIISHMEYEKHYDYFH